MNHGKLVRGEQFVLLLQGCGLTVQALAKMTEAELAALTGDLLPKRSRILLLLQARHAVKTVQHAGGNDNRGPGINIQLLQTT